MFPVMRKTQLSPQTSKRMSSSRVAVIFLVGISPLGLRHLFVNSPFFFYRDSATDIFHMDLNETPPKVKKISVGEAPEFENPCQEKLEFFNLKVQHPISLPSIIYSRGDFPSSLVHVVLDSLMPSSMEEAKLKPQSSMSSREVIDEPAVLVQTLLPLSFCLCDDSHTYLFPRFRSYISPITLDLKSHVIFQLNKMILLLDVMKLRSI